jgi:hypothetical protein
MQMRGRDRRAIARAKVANAHDNGAFAIRLMAVALLALFALSVLVGPARAGDVTESDRGPVRMAIESQIEAFKAGNHDLAYSFAAPSIQRIFPSVDRFIAMVKGGYDPLYSPESYYFGRDTDISGTIHQEVIVTDRNGRQWQAVYTLQRQEDGSWKITGVKMNPYTGAST